ncbi:TetR/AcrR family transcriptional regulator [Paenibacillus sp. p3-SID867]|uniref:TetR/AcrR family transcriptional regulator n=1 Tax=Paenibacillus sp. p3-SID867 TaxID=2916363 RepID=UPI0021A2856C|nr:TetR/AcrR family transcriptional regulator [Paenibacillus sp. p3-SID867]MCT1401021.1 TetR/AcrR family transcriptional regulator [Paenibacillus sp. p3-SID867]
MKQEERREQTKRILLEATEDLIREQGCSQTTLNDIMKRSGLSKGAIFHYVSSKDELFVHVLRAKLAEQNEQFMSEVNKQGDIKQFDGPMNTIINSMSRLESRDDVSNLIFMYLIGKSDQPEIADIVAGFYREATATSKQWIVTGQEAGVIPESIDAERTAELFELLSFGLRMRGLIGVNSHVFTTKDYTDFIIDILRPGNGEEGKDGL